MTKTLLRKSLNIVTGIFLSFLHFSQSESKAEPLGDNFVTAKAAFLMDSKTGAILYEKNSDLPLSPASTTKIMTAAVALERKSLDDSLTVSTNATEVAPCKAGLRAGEQWPMKDLLYCLLLNSANDASLVVAEGTAGSVEEFIRLMNARAQEIGASNTHFANPHGLSQQNHYSTVRDMTFIFQNAVKNFVVRQMLETKEILLKGPDSRPILLKSHNKLLDNFDQMIIGKTGYTRKAQRCFVGEGSRNGKTLLVCVFGSMDHFKDAAVLFDYGFNQNVKH